MTNNTENKYSDILSPFFEDDFCWPITALPRRQLHIDTTESSQVFFKGENGLPDAIDWLETGGNLGIELGNGIFAVEVCVPDFPENVQRLGKSKLKQHIRDVLGETGIDLSKVASFKTREGWWRWALMRADHNVFYDRTIIARHPGFQIRTSGYLLLPGSFHPPARSRVTWGSKADRRNRLAGSYVSIQKAEIIFESAEGVATTPEWKNVERKHVEQVLSLIDPVPLDKKQYEKKVYLQPLFGSVKNLLGDCAHETLKNWTNSRPRRNRFLVSEAEFAELVPDELWGFSTLLAYALHFHLGEGVDALKDLVAELGEEESFRDAFKNHSRLKSLAGPLDFALKLPKRLVPEPIPDEIQKLNELYAIVLRAGTDEIFLKPTCEHDALKLSKEAFLNRNDPLTGLNNQEMRDRKAKWLSDPRAERYDGWCFNPASSSNNRTLNLFAGFPKYGNREGCSRILDCWRNVICAGNETAFDYLTKWHAHLIQYPGRKPMASVVFRGGDLHLENQMSFVLRHLVGRYFHSLGPLSAVEARLDSVLEDKLVVQFSDRQVSEVSAGYNRFVELALCDKLNLWVKYRPAATVNSFHRVVVFAATDFRPDLINQSHFAVFDCAHAKLKGAKNFKNTERFSTQQVAGLIEYLRKIDLLEFDPSDVPAELQTMSNTSDHYSDCEVFFRDCLATGKFPEIDTSNWRRGELTVCRDDFRNSYYTWCDGENLMGPREYNKSGGSNFGKELRKVLPEIQSKQIRLNGVPTRCYVLPPLRKCCELLGVPY